MRFGGCSAKGCGCSASAESAANSSNGTGVVLEMDALSAWSRCATPATRGLSIISLTISFQQSTLPTLPPIFAVAASRSSSCLAIACEDSTLRILNILDGELELVSKIEVGGPGKVRALSLAWGPPVAPTGPKGKERDDSPEAESKLPKHYATPAESYLVAGCSNSTIRRFDVPASGDVVGIWRGGPRMTLDRLKGEHTVVWTIAVLANGTAVSGDSMGNVKFWDVKMGTQTQSFRAHRADVLALALGSDGTSIFTSGVDQKTVEFRQVTVASSRIHDVPSGRWVQASGRRLHAHDVRAIVISPPYSLPLPSPAPSSVGRKALVPIMTSAGLDLSLILTPVSTASNASATKKRSLPNPVSDVPSTEFGSTVHRRAAYVPQRTRPFSVAAGSDSPRLLVCRRDRGVSIWKLDDPKRAGSSLGLGANAAPLQKPRWGRSAFALGLEEAADEEEEVVGTTGFEKVAELDFKVRFLRRRSYRIIADLSPPTITAADQPDCLGCLARRKMARRFRSLRNQAVPLVVAERRTRPASAEDLHRRSDCGHEVGFARHWSFLPLVHSGLATAGPCVCVRFFDPRRATA